MYSCEFLGFINKQKKQRINFMENVVYLITRTDGQKYVGITCEFKKRMSVHKKTKRFEQGIESIDILAECETYEEAEKLEPMYIKEYNTYYNGLNESINGKGNHLAPDFTTKGYKFTEEQKQNMKDNHWSKRMQNTWTKTGIHSEEQRQQWSEKRKGKSWGGRKIPRDKALELIKLYEEDLITYPKDFIKQFVKVKDKERVETVAIEELKAPNGKYLNKLKLFSEYFANDYSVTPTAIKNIIMFGVAENAKQV